MNLTRRGLQLVVAAVAFTTIGCPPTGLQIRRFDTAVLSDARAEELLGEMSSILIVDDGPGDVACAAAFVLDGPVTPFDTGDGSIDSAAELDAVLDLPGDFKVVNAINWCGGFAPSIIVCHPVPGKSLTVVRVAPDLEATLWLHHYGHIKGLSDRNDVNAVMGLGNRGRRVNNAECDAFKS